MYYSYPGDKTSQRNTLNVCMSVADEGHVSVGEGGGGGGYERVYSLFAYQ